MRATIDLYRHYDASGDLLYVGISHNALRRTGSHMRASHWASQITRIEIKRFATREDALEAETFAIQRECPRHNIQHTPAAKGPRGKRARCIAPVDVSALTVAAGGDAAFARLLGIETQDGVAQRVNNWKRRGMPSAVELEHYEKIQELKGQLSRSANSPVPSDTAAA